MNSIAQEIPQTSYVQMHLFIIVHNVQKKVSYPHLPFTLFQHSISTQRSALLHVGAVSGLRRHRLALDALSTGVVILGLLADVGRSGVRGHGRLAGAVALSVTSGVVGSEALLLGLLLLELLAGAGTAAGREG
jgi:hypothetical protein